MSGTIRAGVNDPPPNTSAEAARTLEAITDNLDPMDVQTFVERVNAYGLDPEAVPLHSRENKTSMRGSLVLSAVSTALVVWLCYFVVTVAMRLNVWPF